MNWRTVRALVLKYAYICSRNTFRAMDVFFWPVMDLLVWGFLTIYMLKVSAAVPSAITFLIGAIIMWNILYRSQQVVCVSFLDDVWSRNLLNIFAGPVRIREYVASACLMGLLQSVVVLVILAAIAAMFYSFNVLNLGLHLGALFANLLFMGWAAGIATTGIIVRWGPPAEALAWAIPFLLQPFSAVFYPVSILPQWMQPLAYIVPASHVFEGMRELLATGTMAEHHFWCALGLNVVYMILSCLIFRSFFEEARRKGLLAKYCA